MRREVVALLDTADGPGALDPPLVLVELSRRGDLAGDPTVELEERVALVCATRLDDVVVAEVHGGAGELGLPVELLADEDGRLLIDADADPVETGDAAVVGVD